VLGGGENGQKQFLNDKNVTGNHKHPRDDPMVKIVRQWRRADAQHSDAARGHMYCANKYETYSFSI